MSIHARCWDLDGAGPVEIIVAQRKSQLLQLSLSQSRLVKRHKEVSGAHATLGASDRHKEEVKLPVATGCRGAFNKVLVDDATRGRVIEFSVAINDEERLDNSLVDDKERYLGFGRGLVVAFVAGRL